MKSLAIDGSGLAVNNGETKPFDDFVPFEIETSIPDRFEKIVRLYPDRLAIKVGASALTYAALNERVNRITRAILAQRGTRSEPIVLMLEQGIDIVAAIFAVLKAGKFYVVLDPSTPIERRGYILANSEAAMVIANTRTSKFARDEAHGRAWLNLDETDHVRASSDPRVAVAPDDLASIAYTSGSTGNPKGVVHSHRSQLHTVMLNTRAARIGCEDKLTLLHSLGFASGQAHLFQSLLNGASLHFLDVNSAGIPRLATWLRDECISIYHSPPSLFRELAAVMQRSEKLSHLRLIRLTGEAISRADYELYKATFAQAALLQVVMNSTEANAISSFTTDGSYVFPDTGSPCGYPVDGKKILLLDDDGHAVAGGQIGEITVKSAYLSLGYWDERDRNGSGLGAFAQTTRERMVRTGDLGWIGADGFLIHLGRKDSMLKIRGFRVEIAEVERALLSHPLVKAAAVSACERAPADKYLVGYIVARPPVVLTTSDMRTFLSNQLPGYMIPSTFVFVESLPMTNGKIDRRALPPPDRGRPQLETRYVAPRSELERDLVALWEESLDVSPVGIEDDFFDLGGYSLLAAKLLQDIKNSLDVEVPLSLLAEQSTIAQLATQITEFRKSDTKARDESSGYKYLVRLQSAPGATPVFCLSHAGNYRGDLLRFAQLGRMIGPPYCFYGIQARGADGISRPHGSVTEMAAAYIKEIRAVDPYGPYYLIGECGAAPIAYEIGQQLNARGDRIGLLVLLDGKYSDPKTRRYIWRRYFWRRFFPWPFYSMHRAAQSQTVRRLRRSVGIRFPELCLLQGKKQLIYALLNSPQIAKMVAAELVWRRSAGSTHNDKTQTKRFAHALARYPLYRMARLRYKYLPYAGKIVVIANAQWCDADPTLGWPPWARDGLEVHKIAGNHDSYITQNIATVASVLKDRLQRAESEARTTSKD